MIFSVNWSGLERSFNDKGVAISFMESRDVGSDLWLETGHEDDSILLISRVKQSNGTFKVEVHNEV